jgi:protein-S-isoprenylcysteine O-methyltransferase Ste14
MLNFVGLAAWIVIGIVAAHLVKALVKRPEATPGHTAVLSVLGALAGLVGGMLGVGIFEFSEPLALSVGGMGGAAVLALFFSWIYRWGIRGLI